MSDKKNIDRLFQERFKDFEATPSDAVWKNIEAKLNQKKKDRKVIPIWWRYAGVAALLLLLLTVGIGYFYERNDVAPSNQVVETENTIPSNSPVKEIHENPSTNSIAKDKNTTSENNLNKIIDAENASDNLSSSNASTLAKTSSEKNNVEMEVSKDPSSKKTSNDFINHERQDAVATNSEEKNKKTILDKSSETHDERNVGLNGKTNNNLAIAENTEKRSNQSDLENATPDSTKTNAILNNIKKNNGALADTEDAENKAIAKNKQEKNNLTIEEVLEENKHIIEKEEHMNRWSITPNAAPVYFNTLSEGSSIGSEFNNNTKTSETNISYGISASYAVNKKLSIRSGVNKVNLGYNTNDVYVFDKLAKSTTSSILSSSTGTQKNPSVNANISENVTLVSAANFESKDIPEALASNSIASINQSISYLEVPLEVQYALSDKRLGINIIGGFSSFFLSGNKLSAEDKGKVTNWKATNINDVSYSANLGLGFQYKFTEKLNLNLEPMFKYQINTFNNTSGNFTPYFIGVYTGIGFKF